MNVKLLLREICQFIDVSENNPNATALKALASKVLFALSQNHFGAVFNRISARLQELSACSEENPDYSDIELIQHIDLDVNRLTKLLTGNLGAYSTFKFIECFLSRNYPKISVVEKVSAPDSLKFAGKSFVELDRIPSERI